MLQRDPTQKGTAGQRTEDEDQCENTQRESEDGSQQEEVGRKSRVWQRYREEENAASRRI